MCVSIHYCHRNIRSKFIEKSSRWRNIFQSVVIYHSRRRLSYMMTCLQGTSKQSCCCFPSDMSLMFVSCTKSRNVSSVHTLLVFLAAAIASVVQRTTVAGVTFKSRDSKSHPFPSHLLSFTVCQFANFLQKCIVVMP